MNANYAAFRDAQLPVGKKLNGRFVVAGVKEPQRLVGVGDDVWVHAFGYWYEGTVAAVGRSRLKVAFTTGSGAQRIKLVDPNNTGLVRHRVPGGEPPSRGRTIAR